MSPKFFYVLLFISGMVFANTKTEINTYKPVISSGKNIQGTCWTNSIASNRPEAWRCMVGNTIHDPCFTTENPKILVCGANPATKNPGFNLELAKQLPHLEIVQAMMIKPWLYKLKNGDVCENFTGTLPATDKGVMSHSCYTPGVENKNPACYRGLLQDSIQQSEVWTAKEITYCSATPNQSKIQPVDIVEVWQ